MTHRLPLGLVLAVSLWAVTTSSLQRRLAESAQTLQDIMQSSDRTVPQSLLDKSECVIIVPGHKKGAFLIGAEYGRGFATCRSQGAGWSAPAAVRLEGGSFGFQAGGQETDIVMLVMNRRGAKRLMKSQFTLGGDAAVAAGPVGRTVEASTDALLTAEILTWSRTRGLFAGVSLQGVTLRHDRKANEELYGQPWSTSDVVFSGLEPSQAALPLMNLLNRYSSRPVR
ncbi:MAG: lipid-binding SYLF domain-containing protein [Bryobacteraceae bacterium]